MPRVSEEHLETRRNQILDGARRQFTANGFHATSMQDILTECGLSAGAVYRYFSGKDDIIAAIAEQAVRAIRATLETADDDLSAGDLIHRALAAVDERAERDDFGRLALQVWAEAARSAPLRDRLASAVRDGRAVVRDRIERRYGPGVDAEAVATVTLALLPGYLQAKVVMGDTDPNRFRHGLDALAALLVSGDGRATATVNAA